MSILSWLVVAVITYFAYNAYQRVHRARKRAEFIRDRRRAAGIPDEDARPFAIARADALSRRSQHRRDQALSMPVEKRMSASTPTRSPANIDHEAAARLSGIPGTLPGYLRNSLAHKTMSMSPSSHRAHVPDRAWPPTSPRSLSSFTHESNKGSSSDNVKRPNRTSTGSPSASFPKARLTNGDPPLSLDHVPTAQPNRKRRHQASPTKTAVTQRDTKGPSHGKSQKIAIPGTFASDRETTDEAMSDATHSAVNSDVENDQSEAMEEDEDDAPGPGKVHRSTRSVNGGPARANRADQLQSLQTAARATAKKREADELDVSDTEQSLDASDEEDYTQAKPHSSKRSRTVNKDVDPSSSLDFDIALPEEAMVDFNPNHDAALTEKDGQAKGSLKQSKRRADTSEDRQPGEEWIDYEGLRWRIHPETHELERWSDVLEWRSKYRMPRDSLHPMAKESHQVVVHKWLTKDEWEDAKAKNLLSFQEPERLAEKERLDKEEAEKMRRKQEVLAKIRQTSSPNKRIQSYLVQQQRKQLQHKLSRGDLSGDVSMNSYVTSEAGDDGASMSIDSSSVLGSGGATPNKPRSRRISLQSSIAAARGGDVVGKSGALASGGSSPSNSPSRRRGSPLASPCRAIQYPKARKGTSASSSPLVTSTFPPPSSSS